MGVAARACRKRFDTTESKGETVHTRREGLLELVNLLGISDGESVQVLGGADLELGDLLGLLDANSWNGKTK